MKLALVLSCVAMLCLAPMVVADNREQVLYPDAGHPTYAVGVDTVLWEQVPTLEWNALPLEQPHVDARATIENDASGLLPGVYLCVYTDLSAEPVRCDSQCGEARVDGVLFLHARVWVYGLSLEVESQREDRLLTPCPAPTTGEVIFYASDAL